MIRSFVAAALLTLSFGASARDCTPVETAPGVKTKPVGCVDLGREAGPRRNDESRRSPTDGWVIQRDGTRTRSFGGPGVETERTTR